MTQTPLLSCEKISKSFGSQSLFKDFSFTLFEGDRVGFMGLNGSGKSTLLKILAGLELPDDGKRVVRRGCYVGYVPQERTFDPKQTITDVLNEALNKLPQPLDDTEKAARMAIILGQTGFADASQLAHQLSGGWRKRLMIATELICHPDVLLLDEPTNHLDFEGIAWLEELLQAATFTYLVISHDRMFLERVAHRTVELSNRYKNGYLSIDGNYSTFIEKREEHLHALSLKQQKLENTLRREIEWLRRGPKARTTKSQARIDEAHRLKSEVADLKTKNTVRTVGIEFTSSDRETRVLIAAKNVRKSHGTRLIFDNLTLNIVKGLRLGLIGLNGTGKTTLLHLLSGHIQPDSGTIKRAHDLKIIYFRQNREALNPNHTLKQALCPTGGDHVVYLGRELHVTSWARRFLFQAETLNMPIRRLSGGERARVCIAQLMLQPADVLLLDEPTNDLDIPTLEVLEENLQDFPGALILVTHDRTMLGTLCNGFLALDGKGGTEAVSDLLQWERSLIEGLQRSDGDKKSFAPAEKNSAIKKKLSYKDKFEYEQMEKKILDAETTLAHVQQEIDNPTNHSNAEKMRTLSQELAQATSEVERLYTRWTELEEMVKGS